MPFLNAIGVTEGVQAATSIAQTIAGISDMAKRRRFEESLALLSNRQMSELNEKIANAQTESDRLQIISSAIVGYAIANENSAAKKETVMYVIAGGLAVMILAGAIFYAVKRKK